MARALFIVLVFALQGCSGLPSRQASASACAQDPAGFACQVENYHRAP